MSEVITEFPKKHLGRPRIYPWDEWSDGQIRRLEKGVDFETSTESLRALAHRTASVMGKKVQTRIKGNTVTIQFYDPS